MCRGPGVAWQFGLGWVVFAAPQIIAGFLVFGVIGKKFAIVGHRIGAVTVIDLIRALCRSVARTPSRAHASSPPSPR